MTDSPQPRRPTAWTVNHPGYLLLHLTVTVVFIALIAADWTSTSLVVIGFLGLAGFIVVTGRQLCLRVRRADR